jgi:hypothetical protein
VVFTGDSNKNVYSSFIDAYSQCVNEKYTDCTPHPLKVSRRDIADLCFETSNFVMGKQQKCIVEGARKDGQAKAIFFGHKCNNAKKSRMAAYIECTENGLKDCSMNNFQAHGACRKGKFALGGGYAQCYSKGIIVKQNK